MVIALIQDEILILISFIFIFIIYLIKKNYLLIFS